MDEYLRYKITNILDSMRNKMFIIDGKKIKHKETTFFVNDHFKTRNLIEVTALLDKHNIEYEVIDRFTLEIKKH